MKGFLFWLLLVIPVLRLSAQGNPWFEDLQKAHDLVMDQAGHIFQYYPRDQWEEDYVALLDSSVTLSKNEIRVALMQLVAKLKDGHSGVWIRQMVMPTENTRWFPFLTYYFKEGLYIIAADKQYKEYVGSRIEKIGTWPEVKASGKLFQIVNGENEWSDQLKAPFMMIYPPIMQGLGFLNESGKLPLTVQLPDGTRTEVQITAKVFGEGLSAFFDQYQAPSAHSVRLDEKLGVEWPYSKWNFNPPYQVEYLEDQSALYLKLNVLRDPAGYSLQSTYKQFWSELEEKKAKKIILDLRNNGGGNLNNAWPFVFKVQKWLADNEEHQLVVLIGRRTFSAATAFVSMLETHTRAVFVGEPSAGRPNQTEGTNVFPPPVLESIAVDVLLSRGRWTHTHPLEDRQYLEPDVWVQESIDDWREGVDKALELALRLK